MEETGRWLVVQGLECHTDMTTAKLKQETFNVTRNGLGTGLPLARRALQRLRGNLKLSSREGEGTSALLMLPLAG